MGKLTGVKGGVTNWPQTMEGMKEIQRRFTIALARIIWETKTPHQVDLIIDGLEKHKWNEPILRRDEVE
ncbi:hypothetical protein AB8U03_00290 [Clostridium sp. Mt-5]|uniref:Uncharacterized protein n=1 Tax=Clostridium moutaii TaxID=3240932 RepID=A0ABV4BM76_9CLOT